MSKDYELLTQEAMEEEFENMAHQTTEKEKSDRVQAMKFRRVEESRPTKLSFGRSSPYDPAEISIEDKGGFEELVTNDNYDDKLKEQEEILNANEHMMWSMAADLFGDPLKFVGNPFDRAKELQKELIECTRQAEELLADQNLVVEEEVEVVETVKSTTSDNE